MHRALSKHLGADTAPGAASTRPDFKKNEGRPGQTYEHVEKLGEGAFGVAHLVRDRRTYQLYVLKTINKRQSQVPPAQMEIEIHNLKACDHPHIIRLFEYYEDYENIYLIMERAAGGELTQVLQEQRKKSMQLPERWVSIVTRQSLQAISYLHSMGIIHKDLKSENILLLYVSDVNDPSSQPHTVIIDLGIAGLFSARLGRRARCTVVAGTPTHMAPEVWLGNFGPVADVWSLGIVLFELLSGELPFAYSSLNSAAECVRQHRQGPNWTLLFHVSGQARALNQRMLFCDDRMRPTAQQCLGHSWFKDDSGGEPVTPSDAAISSEAPATLTPRVAPGLAMSDPGERLLKSLHNFGQSKFEKTVLLQIASQLHTSQVGRIGDVFAAADLARSGLLDKTDFVTVLRGLGASPEDAESYVSCLDVNEIYGQVEYADFVAGCIGLLLESLRGLLWQSFCVIDVDGNGVLGREEVHAVVTHAELHKYGFPCGGDRSVGEALDGMDIDKNGQISFDELCRHFLPQRPDLPSPVLSPKTPRDRSGCRSGVAASAGYEISSGFQASSGALGGAREKISHVPTLRDEDFAQLLDEIEADHDDLSVPNNSSLLGSGAGGMDTLQREASVSSLLTFNAPSSNLDGYGINPLEEPLHLEDSAGILLGTIEAPTPPPPTAADVDEELSRMLADIANGP